LSQFLVTLKMGCVAFFREYIGPFPHHSRTFDQASLKDTFIDFSPLALGKLNGHRALLKSKEKGDAAFFRSFENDDDLLPQRFGIAGERCDGGIQVGFILQPGEGGAADPV
jgi:hypothetical protein